MQKNLIALIAIFYLFIGECVAQQWIDTVYNFTKTEDLVYGTATDFAGTNRDLYVDISTPTNDTPPTCGRPLFVFIHGGGFIGGNRKDNTAQNLTRHFAKRGYVAASVSYRYGFFHTDAYRHCNLTNWDCLNAQDTSEWYRAAYRAMQDVKGAIRYLVANKIVYNIDPRNVFVVGESAGGITALSVGYMDLETEKPIDAGLLPNALAPNNLYFNQCISSFGLATSIASMNLSRPDLGSIEGTLHLGENYTVRGVGNFIGGMFQNYLANAASSTPPVLYMFHQPNDLTIPYNASRLFNGFISCANTYWGCQSVPHRAVIYGSSGINKIIGVGGPAMPTRKFDSTFNNNNCLTQLANPSTVGHSISSLATRSNSMASFFASAIDTSTALCIVSLPIKFISAIVEPSALGPHIIWTCDDEQKNLWAFELYKSSDAMSWELLNTIPANGGTSYDLYDLAPSNDRSYYKIAAIENNGTKTYSATLKYDYSNFERFVSCWPNPAQDVLNIHITNDIPSSVKLEVYNSAGNLVLNPTFYQTLPNQKYTIDVSALADGMYYLKYKSSRGVITSKFVIHRSE